MVIYLDQSQWPACTHDGCGVDSFGTYHGLNCARSRHAQAELDAWKDTPGAFRSNPAEADR